MRATSSPFSGVESMHDLKTGSYTVRGPLGIGAVLAGATPDQRAALDRFAAPLGVAFQLRDDLLGTFGDPRATGKPAGNDVRRGKRTALVAALADDADARPLMKRAFGVADASDADVAALVARMEASGARARVEERLRELLAHAERELTAAPLGATGKAWLNGAVKALGERDS
jgi:geranylgeranyl diphosphate synthase type I